MSSTPLHRRALPHRLRLLCVGPLEPPWALISLRLDAAGCAEAEFRWHSEAASAFTLLRRERFDCILTCDDRTTAGTMSFSTSFIEGLRASGADDAVVVLLLQPNDEVFGRFDELDCEVLISPHGWHSRSLIAVLRRALSRGEVGREVHSLEQTVRTQRLRERDEADALLLQQRAVIGKDANGRTSKMAAIPQRAQDFYRDLLRTFVMMATGTLQDDVRQLTEILALADVPPQNVMEMHLDQVARLIAGLGGRSSRHVLARADILALDLMTQLGESYRHKSPKSGLGDAGVNLMHAESLLQKRSSEPRKKPVPSPLDRSEWL